MSNKQNGQRETRLITALWHAQNGRCFHCNEPMMIASMAGFARSRGWTREHVYPRSGTGKALAHNIVLAHPPCNEAKGFRPPSDDEIERARAIYRLLGLEPFVPARRQRAPDISRLTRVDSPQRRLVGHDVKPGAFATLADAAKAGPAR